MRVFNPEVSVGTANILRISYPPAPPPSTLIAFLHGRGRDWQQIVFVEETTGAVRYTADLEQAGGHFATNLWFLTSKKAQGVLELSSNRAAYKHRIKIAAGTTAMVGCMTSSNVIQYYFADTIGLTYFDSTTADS